MDKRLRKNIFPVVSGWVAAISLDLFLHAGLLAALYTNKSPFLLDADTAFRRIPLGYLSFLLLTGLLLWLMKKTGAIDRRGGAVFGLKFGFATWGAFVIGLYSIATANAGLLLGWWAGQTIELGLSGFVMGACLEGVGKKKIVAGLAAFFVLMVMLTVILQILGVAPPMKKI